MAEYETMTQPWSTGGDYSIELLGDPLDNLNIRPHFMELRNRLDRLVFVDPEDEDISYWWPGIVQRFRIVSITNLLFLPDCTRG